MNVAPTAARANTGSIRERLASLVPAKVGAKPKRFATVKSDLLFALRRYGAPPQAHRTSALAPKWNALWARLPDKYAKAAMSRLFRFCSARGIAPAEVNDGVLDQFEAHLCNETLIKASPWVTRQSACRLWNRLASVVDGWPAGRLNVPRRADHYSLGWDVFPLSLRDEVEAYLARLADDDPLALDAPPSPLSASTVTAYRNALRRFASILVHLGHPPKAITGLAYLVEPAHVEAGLRFLIDRRGGKPTPIVRDMAVLLFKVAKYGWKLKGAPLDRLAGFVRKLRVPIGGLTVRNRERLVPLRDPANLVRLFALPRKIAKSVDTKSLATRKDALLVQQAVALMILTYAPLRISNLAALRLDRHLRWSRPDLGGQLVVNIDAAEVKNREALSFPLPEDCADLVRIYIRRFRPLLAGAGSAYLFPGSGSNRSKRADTLGKQISSLIRRTIGLEVNPHLYRHLVHLVVLNRYPGAYAMVSRVLGHKSLQTAISNYAGEDIAIATRTYQALIRDVSAGREITASPHDVVRGLNARAQRRGF